MAMTCRTKFFRRPERAKQDGPGQSKATAWVKRQKRIPSPERIPLTLMPFGNSELESQRDSIVQPRVATEELPWVNAPTMTYPNGVASSHRFPANLIFRKALPLTRIFHSETGKTMANPCSAGFQTCVPCLFNHAFERVCAPLFMGFFATLSKMAMKYPG